MAKVKEDIRVHSIWNMANIIANKFEESKFAKKRKNVGQLKFEGFLFFDMFFPEKVSFIAKKAANTKEAYEKVLTGNFNKGDILLEYLRFMKDSQNIVREKERVKSFLFEYFNRKEREELINFVDEFMGKRPCILSNYIMEEDIENQKNKIEKLKIEKSEISVSRKTTTDIIREMIIEYDETNYNKKAAGAYERIAELKGLLSIDGLKKLIQKDEGKSAEKFDKEIEKEKYELCVLRLLEDIFSGDLEEVSQKCCERVQSEMKARQAKMGYVQNEYLEIKENVLRMFPDTNKGILDNDRKNKLIKEIERYDTDVFEYLLKEFEEDEYRDIYDMLLDLRDSNLYEEEMSREEEWKAYLAEYPDNGTDLQEMIYIEKCCNLDIKIKEEESKLKISVFLSGYLDDIDEKKGIVIKNILAIRNSIKTFEENINYSDFEKEKGKYIYCDILKKEDDYFAVLCNDRMEISSLFDEGYVYAENTYPKGYSQLMYENIKDDYERVAYAFACIASCKKISEMSAILFKKDIAKQFEERFLMQDYISCMELMRTNNMFGIESVAAYVYIDYFKGKLCEKGLFDSQENFYENCFNYAKKNLSRSTVLFSDYYIGAACYELAHIELDRFNGKKIKIVREKVTEYINAALSFGYLKTYDMLGNMYYKVYNNYDDDKERLVKELKVQNGEELTCLNNDTTPLVAAGCFEDKEEVYLKRAIICYFLAKCYSSYHKIRRILQTLRKDNGEYNDTWYKEAEEKLEELSKAYGHMVYPDLEGRKYLPGRNIKEWLEEEHIIGDIDSEADIETYVFYNVGIKTKIFLESLNMDEKKRLIVVNCGQKSLSLPELSDIQIVNCATVGGIKDILLSLRYFRLHKNELYEDKLCDELEEGKNKYHFMALEDEIESNVQFAKLVMEYVCGYVYTAFIDCDLERIREKFLDICDLVVNVDPITVELILDPVQDSFGDFFVKTKYIFYDYEISKQLLLNCPLFAPQLLAERKGRELEILDVIVLGNDKSIPVLVKNILSVAYIPRKVIHYKVRVTIIEDASGMFQNQLMVECPGLFAMEDENGVAHMYNVEFTDCSYDSYEFRQVFQMKCNFTDIQKTLREKIDNCRYFVCAMKTDKESIMWGMQIRQWLYQKDAFFDENVSISVLCRKELYVEQVKNIRVDNTNLAPMWFANYNLNVYGQEKACFSYNNIYDDFISGIQRAVFEGDRETYDRKSLNYVTRGEAIFNIRKNKYYSSWYDRDSADMRNLYLIYRLYSTGVFDNLVKWNYNEFLSKAKEYNDLYIEKLGSFNIMLDNLKISDRQTVHEQIAANEVLTKDFLSRNEHHRWIGFMLSRGWQCPADFDYVESYMDKGNPEYKCSIAKMHPAIRPFEQPGDLKNDMNPDNDKLMQVRIDQLKEAHSFPISKKSVKRYNAEAIKDSVNWLKYYERQRGSKKKEKRNQYEQIC